MSRFPISLVLLLLAVGLGAVGWVVVDLRNRPVPQNVVFIVLDTTRADALGPYGYERETTPSLDRFAAESLVFERAYSHVPWTIPSVASMFTAKTPIGHGIVEWGQKLNDELLTLAEVFQSHGYQTHGIVSHHAFREAYNLHQGFDTYDLSIIEANNPSRSSTAPLVSERGLAAVDELATSESPFFLWLHYFDAHNDYMRHEGIDFGRRPRDVYDGEVLYQDQALGSFFDGLEARGLTDDTIVIVISDHGEEFREHGMRYHTGQLYDESVRIPLIMRFPGFAPARISGVIGESDVGPTLLSLMNLPVPEEFRGIAVEERERFIPYWAGRRLGETPNRGVYLETLRWQNRRGLVRDNWKLIHDLKSKEWLLYDLKEDPGEKVNLYKSKKNIRKSMKKELATHTSQERYVQSAEALDEETVRILRSLGYVD